MRVSRCVLLSSHATNFKVSSDFAEIDLIVVFYVAKVLQRSELRLGVKSMCPSFKGLLSGLLGGLD